jgi:hypothetical protein
MLELLGLGAVMVENEVTRMARCGADQTGAKR